jgi:hypothetical protein
VRRFLLTLIAVLAASHLLHAGPLEDRRAAIDRALNFVYRTASDDGNLAQFGGDMLWCFYSISHTASDRELSQTAARMGRELAQRWSKLHRHVPADASALDIYKLVSGAYAAELLGFPDRQLKAELHKAARRFKAQDFLGFDPALAPPAPDDPNRYDLLTDALIHTYFGDSYGIRLGASYRDVLKLLPRFRPYDGHDEDMEFDIFYAVTHLIYTLNRYNERRIDRGLVPQELTFLRRKLVQAIDDEDPEIVGEALDCLKSAGFENDPEVRKGMDYLVANQRPDGAWAGDADDIYTEYHSAWTGIDGLRDYHYRGRVSKLPVEQ